MKPGIIIFSSALLELRNLNWSSRICDLAASFPLPHTPYYTRQARSPGTSVRFYNRREISGLAFAPCLRMPANIQAKVFRARRGLRVSSWLVCNVAEEPPRRFRALECKKRECPRFALKSLSLIDLCVSSLCRGHANLLCFVPVLVVGQFLAVPMEPSRSPRI